MSILKQPNFSDKLASSRTSARWLCPFLSATFALFFQCGITHAQVNWLNSTGSPSPWYYAGANWSSGNRPSSTQTAQFNLGSTYDVWWNGATQAFSPSVGQLKSLAGYVTFENQESTQYELKINGTGGSGFFSNLSIDGANTRLNIRGIHLNSLGGAEIINGARLTVDGSHAAGSQFSVNGNIGLNVSGTMTIQSGGNVSTTRTYVGLATGTTGTINLIGSGSTFTSNSSLFCGNNGTGNINVNSGTVMTTNNSTYIGIGGGPGNVAIAGGQWNSNALFSVGDFAEGTVDITSAGQFNNTSNSYLGYTDSSKGTINVTGSGSQFNNTSLVIGNEGEGILNVQSGGHVSSSNGSLAFWDGAKGTATINGFGSQWENTGNLNIGGQSTVQGGVATLDITDNGLVTVGGNTKIWSTGTVNLDGGRFEFGQTASGEFNSINAVSGSLAGTVTHAGYTNVSSLANLQNSLVDVSDVVLSNSGTLYGDASLGSSLNNLSIGSLEAVAGERLRFLGAGNSNAGQISNFGGTIRFEEDVTNQSGGFVAGRGQFVANGGWTNSGVMAFSGPTEVLGDLVNETSGLIVTSGGTTTTFFDDVVNNGEIRTSADSASVFFGSASGSGSYTGTGSVYLEGDLRPGNSPGVIGFEGDLILGSLANMQIELAGLELGEFDRLEIAGDLSLDGFLTVELLDNYQLNVNEEFLIADVGGSLFGQFTGLGEGDLVGNFGGMDLFITYTAGNGNDVGLFTPVPEPGTCGGFRVRVDARILLPPTAPKNQCMTDRIKSPRDRIATVLNPLRQTK